MTKLQAEIADNKYQVEIKREGSLVFANIDGREYELEVSTPEPNVFLIKNENRIYEAFVSPGKNADEPMQVRIGANEIEIKLIDPRRLRGRGRNDENTDGIAEIKTAMPGKVVRILVEKGRDIEKGEGVVVVEAMKMQNELKSPKSGVVKEILVEEGSTVSAGDVLVTVE